MNQCCGWNNCPKTHTDHKGLKLWNISKRYFLSCVTGHDQNLRHRSDAGYVIISWYWTSSRKYVALIEQNNAHCKDAHKYHVPVQHISTSLFHHNTRNFSSISTQSLFLLLSKKVLWRQTWFPPAKLKNVQSACNACGYSAWITE